MKRFSLLPLGLLFSFPTMAFATENSDTLLEQEVLTGKTTTETSVDLNKDLDQATSGLGRFRFGFSAGGGYYKSVSVDNYPNMGGFSGELGVYTLFNPIRDWADVELGVRTLYVFPHDSKSKNSETGTVKQKSYSGLNSGSIYDGLVFRFPGHLLQLQLECTKILWQSRARSHLSQIYDLIHLNYPYQIRL
ncbi:hypothetical protein [Glaesserella parasuis]|uniref:hypothetical protein n=1 Tax=Glaesserella parasuis TaxID=738 RepID=UPI00274E93EF|nr:hypothetical protein [Glaesserella parasuis]